LTVDAQLISYIVDHDDLRGVQRMGITQDHFLDEWRQVYRWLLRQHREHNATPSRDTLLARFPDQQLVKVRKSELPIFIADARQRKKYIGFLQALNDAVENTDAVDKVEEGISELQGQLISLAFQESTRSHLVDLFSKEITKRVAKEIKRRKSVEYAGLKTGLKRFDTICGGMMKQRLITVIGRPSVGKSWLSLFLAAAAVEGGAKVVVYPLEMTLFEVATRLYSIFTQQMFGPTRALKNLDLTSGRISMYKVHKFLAALEDKYGGQLYVADVASLSDPYTTERIESEVELLTPDMFWVDSINLLRAVGGSRDEKGHERLGRLSKGLKNAAMRQNVIGGMSAQVNREGIRNQKAVFLPRLEHIYGGDTIGQDSDQVFSFNKKGDLYYALVKNRHGPEIGPTRVRFQPNIGVLRETTEQEDD
jgi:replicative DNA helicase